MKQFTALIVKEAFSFKNPNSRGRPTIAKLGDKFYVTSPDHNNKNSVIIDRANKAHIDQGYLFDLETIKKYFFLEDEKHNCPSCNGSGKLQITVTTVNADNFSKDSMDINCIYCNGTGSFDTIKMIRYIEEQNWHKNAWCKCENRSGKVSYHGDTPQMKHHWTCDDCSKIVQIG